MIKRSLSLREVNSFDRNSHGTTAVDVHPIVLVLAYRTGKKSLLVKPMNVSYRHPKMTEQMSYENNCSHIS